MYLDFFCDLLYDFKGQLNSECIYEVIISPKMPTKNYITKISALPSNKLPGQKSENFLVGILGGTITP